MVLVKLSNRQISRCRNGHQIEISKKGVKCEGAGLSVDLALAPRNFAKLEKAKAREKGCRISLTKQEVEGSGLLDLLKKGVKGIKKGLALSKKHLGKKKTREILTEGVKAVAKFAPGPLPGLANEFADDLVNFVGDKTGAFGVPCDHCQGTGFRAAGSGFRVAGEGMKKRKSKKKTAKRTAPVVNSRNFSSLLPPSHPAMNPAKKMPDPQHMPLEILRR